MNSRRFMPIPKLLRRHHTGSSLTSGRGWERLQQLIEKLAISELGQAETIPSLQNTAALSSIADSLFAALRRRLVPEPDSCAAANELHGCNALLDHLVGK
jgi:hypothetical protein